MGVGRQDSFSRGGVDCRREAKVFAREVGSERDLRNFEQPSLRTFGVISFAARSFVLFLLTPKTLKFARKLELSYVYIVHVYA